MKNVEDIVEDVDVGRMEEGEGGRVFVPSGTARQPR